MCCCSFNSFIIVNAYSGYNSTSLSIILLPYHRLANKKIKLKQNIILKIKVLRVL